MLIQKVMKLLFFVLLLLFNYGFSEPGVDIGYNLTMQVPDGHEMGFTGKAFFIDTKETEPHFRVALGVEEGINGKYSCSLEVFLGDVKVWDSGHYSKFYTSEKCFLELTKDGDLRLKGPKGIVGWKTGTSGQGVKSLQILSTGNLVLVDAMNNIKWQSFNFPTDVILRGQQLDVATHLTSFRRNSTLFYSFEIENKKVSLYLNSDKLKYSYWEFQPSMNRSISYVKLSSKGLVLFDVKYKKIAQILSQSIHPLKFLALKNDTGNLGLYYYSPEIRKFDASFQALNNTCDLPIACKPYGVCTLSNTCSCIQLLTNENKNENKNSGDCGGEFSGGFCSGKEAEMLELDNNQSADEAECYLYRLVLGLKQVDKGTGFSYMVKVPKGSVRNHGKHNVKTWILVAVGVADGIIVLLLFGLFGYWLIKRRSHTLHNSQARTS
ncbi:EP1-like glycoprotein 3 isoform X2 [Lotus japonicus]|uniref:EP1-like glycoprotein 3 isoform X2 n=1 Tax=Lotus japonicus TaxID=34305 RepID=UPI00258AAAEB|nr:EP1-like glycoprotein 3 isoform X2 [Lotus japonicus]